MKLSYTCKISNKKFNIKLLKVKIKIGIYSNNTEK